MIELIFWTCIGLIFYTYIGYFIVLWIMYSFRNTQRTVKNDYFPKVSLIVSAYNEESVIADKIDNCKSLEYPEDHLEILFGLDGSTDNTENIIRKNKNGTIKHFVFKKQRGKSTVLNDLVYHASGEILIFSDANTIYEQDAIKKLIRHFINPQVGGVCGKLILLDSQAMDIGSKGEKMYWDYETRLKFLEGHVKSVLGANGAIYAIRKELFEKLPEDKLVIDDFLIPMKVIEKGFKVLYDETAIGVEYTNDSIWKEFKRKIRIGTGNFNAIPHISKMLSPSKGMIALGLWSHKIIRWFIPFLGVIVLVANILLLGKPLYNIALAIQIGFYVAVLVGALLNSLGIYKNIFAVIFYFFVVNLALLIGFYKFVLKSEKPTWKTVKRKSDV